MLKKWFNTCWPHLALQGLAFAFYSGEGLFLLTYLFAGLTGWILTLMYLIYIFPVMYGIISYSEKKFEATPIQIGVTSVLGALGAMVLLMVFSFILQAYSGRGASFDASFSEGLKVIAVILPLLIGGEIMRRILFEMNK